MAFFKDIVGQDAAVEHLRRAIEMDKISHAYIILGEKESGKMMMAETFAMAMQCETKADEPCQVCRSCKQALNHNHPDIKVVTHEKPNSIGVDEIRAQVNGDVEIKPYQGPKKVYIIPDAEKMTQQAQNAILKTLEEPPQYAVIMLLTTSMEALLPTIQSRCVTLSIKPVADAILQSYLMTTIHIPDYKAKVCTAFARGNLGKAVMLATSEDFDEMKQEVLHVIKNVKDMEVNQMVAAVKKINEYKMDVSAYLDICIVWYRDVLLFKATRDVNQLIFKEEIQAIRNDADHRSYEGLEAVLKAIEKANNRLKANVNQDLTLELMFMVLKEEYRKNEVDR